MRNAASGHKRLVAVVLIGLALPRPAAAKVSLHVSLVIDSEGGSGFRGALLRVDGATGRRSVVTDFGRQSAPGEPLGVGPVAVTVEPSGDILVVDRNADLDGRGEFKGALFRVEPATGRRTVVSDFGNRSEGPLGENPSGVAVSRSGNILVLDPDAGTAGKGALFRLVPRAIFDFTPPFIHIVTERRLLSDFGRQRVATEPLGEEPLGLAVEPSGNILVVDSEAGTARKGALVRVDGTTGERSLVSDFGRQTVANEPLGETPVNVIIEDEAFVGGDVFSGSLLVIDLDAGTDGRGALFRIDASTGERTVLSDFGVSSQGPLGQEPSNLARDGFGKVQVVDAATDPATGDIGRGALFEVSPTDGHRLVLSDFNDDQGPPGLLAQGLYIIPVPLVIDADAEPQEPSADVLSQHRGALFSVDPLNGHRTLLNDFNDPLDGDRLGSFPAGLAIEGPDSVLVVDADAGPGGSGAIFSVDLSTCGLPTERCRRTTVCTGGTTPVGLVVDASGILYVLDRDDSQFRGSRGSLFRITRPACEATRVMDFGNPVQTAPLGRDPANIARGPFGSLLAVDFSAGSDARGILFGLSATGDVRAVITNFNTGELKGNDPVGVALETSDILVLDQTAGTDAKGALFRVDGGTHRRTVVSDFGIGEPMGTVPINIAVEASGNVLVIDADAGSGMDPSHALGPGMVTGGRGALFRIDPRTGQRRLLSDFGNPEQGPLGSTVHGIAVALTPLLLKELIP